MTTFMFSFLDKSYGASQVVLVEKNPPASAGDIRDVGFDPWVGKIPWSRKWQPTPVFLPGKFHGLGDPVDYSPWCLKQQSHD